MTKNSGMEVLKWVAGILGGLIVGLALPPLSEIMDPPKPFSIFEVSFAPIPVSEAKPEANPNTSLALSLSRAERTLATVSPQPLAWNSNQIPPMSLREPDWIPFHDCGELTFSLKKGGEQDFIAGRVIVTGHTADGKKIELFRDLVCMGKDDCPNEQSFPISKLRCN